MTTYRVTSQADRDMHLTNLSSDAVQDYWFDIDASSETENVGEFEIDPRHANHFEQILSNDPAVISFTRK